MMARCKSIGRTTTQISILNSSRFCERFNPSSRLRISRLKSRTVVPLGLDLDASTRIVFVIFILSKSVTLFSPELEISNPDSSDR